MMWGRARLLGLMVIGATVYGVVGYMVIEHWSFLDAFYMTILALSTVGFREVHALDGGGVVFTITLIMLGVAIVLVTVSVISVWVSDQQLGLVRRRRRMEKRADAMHDHVIVCAYGRVGRAVARDLDAAGAQFLVIDIDEDLVPRMLDDQVDYLIGDPSSEPLLEAAGVARARGLVCAVDSDATNVYITLVARSMNPDLLIVARASEPNSAERLMKAGADRVVSPYVSSGRHMAMMAMDPTMVDILDVAGRSDAVVAPWVEEIVVDEASGLAGQPVAHAAAGAVLAIRHKDGAVTRGPGPDVTLREGDLLLRLSTAP